LSYFLVFGKREMGLQRSRACIAGEVSAMIEEHTFLLREAGYNMICPEQYPAACIDVDLAYFGRVIDNIFSNIGKYADKGRQVTIRAEERCGKVILCFENYIRTDKSLPESNRIGLKTCSKIMEQMGGEIEIDECLDRFSVKITLAAQ
jgi:signal transduction histidine kinase